MAKAIEPRIVVALESFVGGLDGEDIRIQKDELFESDHPAVHKWPDKFGPLVVKHPVQRAEIEQATAAPGEKRGA